MGRPHGVKGEVAIVVMSDYPDRFVAGARFETESRIPLEIERVRLHRDVLLAKFQGVDDRSAVERLRGSTLTIAASERRPLGDDEYWPEELKGLTAVEPGGDRLGVVVGVILGDAQDRLVVKTPKGTDVEVPLVSDIVGDVHPSGGFVMIDPPEGLF